MIWYKYGGYRKTFDIVSALDGKDREYVIALNHVIY